jgi:hypothetical protein
MNEFIIGNLIDIGTFMLAMILLFKVAYMLGKYQAFEKNPQFDMAWWRIHYKLREGKPKHLESASQEPQNPNNANDSYSEH